MKRPGRILFLVAVLSLHTVTCGCTKLFAPTFFPINVDLSIDLSRAGNTAETTFRLWRDDVYEFALVFSSKNLLDGNNEVIKYLCGVEGFNYGHDVPVHMLLAKKTSKGEEIVIDDKISTQKCVCSFGGQHLKRSPIIGPLDAGLYRIRLTNLKDHQQLKYVPVNMYV